MGDPIIKPRKTYKNLKEGDYLTAKKDFHIINNFYKGESYQITTINNYIGLGECFCLFWVGAGPEYFTTKDNDINHEYIWDHFYTEKELRNLKLKEIETRSK